MCARDETAVVDKIEITPAMIAAGVSALASYDPRFESEEEFIERLLSSVLKTGRTV